MLILHWKSFASKKSVEERQSTTLSKQNSLTLNDSFHEDEDEQEQQPKEEKRLTVHDIANL